MERTVVVIVGPTCSGKTYLGLKLAKKLNTEIISADSRQFYKKLNIGTAKPTEEELQSVKHHFINLLSPDEYFNVSKFDSEANKLLAKLISKDKIPIVVGGSGLYIKTLIDGIFNTADKDEEYRDELLFKKKKYGNEYLYNELLAVDPRSAKTMLPQNWKRVIRALEVLHLTGEPIWKHYEKQKNDCKYQFLQFGLNWERDILYENINSRVDQMISNGLVKEVKNLLNEGYSKKINSLNTVGYKEIISYLENEITLEHAIGLIKRNTRRYAKRQLTWFRKDERIKWYDVKDYEDLNKVANKISLHLK